jgi:hypothetical protein
MNLKDKSLVRFFIAAALILFLVGISFAGGLKSAKIEAQLGVRYLSAISENMKAGAIVQASVVDPAKLAKFGIKAKKGDVISLVQGERKGLFRMEFAGQKKNFSADEQGVLRAY